MGRERKVWFDFFISLKAYQLHMGYLMMKFDSFTSFSI